jgi:hypothetical protein
MLILGGMVKQRSEVIYPVLAIKLGRSWVVGLLVFGLWFLVCGYSFEQQISADAHRSKKNGSSTVTQVSESACICVHLRLKLPA